MKALIFITVFFASLSMNSQAQYYGRRYYRPVVPRYYAPVAYRPVTYYYYWHQPVVVNYQQVINYNVNAYYAAWVNQGLTNYFYGSWFMLPTRVVPNVNIGFNGLVTYNQYPYFAFNGYLHRYSTVDTCNYQLVNKLGHSVVRNFAGVCSNGYNSCAAVRDGLNYRARSFQFFCAETYRQRNF